MEITKEGLLEALGIDEEEFAHMQNMTFRLSVMAAIVGCEGNSDPATLIDRMFNDKDQRIPREIISHIFCENIKDLILDGEVEYDQENNLLVVNPEQKPA